MPDETTPNPTPPVPPPDSVTPAAPPDQPPPPRRSMLSRVLKVVAGLVVIVAIIVLVPVLFGIPSSLINPTIRDRVEKQTGYRLDIRGTTRIGLWPAFNVTLNDITMQPPKGQEGAGTLTVESVQANIALASLLSGKPEVSGIVVDQPVLHLPLLRERARETAEPRSLSVTKPLPKAAGGPLPVKRVIVTDGAIEFATPDGRVKNRIEGLSARAIAGSARDITVNGSASMGDRPLKFRVKATVPELPLGRQNVPVEMTLDAPSLLQLPLNGRAEVRMNGPVLMINSLSGDFGGGPFTGWASADLSTKPLVKVDLDFQRLDIAVPPEKRQASNTRGLQGAANEWSDTALDIDGLNYLDAQVRLSVAELNVGDARFAPATIDANLMGGVMNAAFSQVGLYDGQANGKLTVDVSRGGANYVMSGDITDVRALPLLSSIADFDSIDGKLQAKLSLTATGDSPRSIVSSLGGTAFVNFRDGEIRGVNLAQMLRSLTANPLSGWQESDKAATDLTQLSASFRIDKGQASTADLALVGPLVRVSGTGMIDLPKKSLALRVEPKLVMTTEGQGSTANPVGFGVPVVVEGPWSEPHIYPDMDGVLNNPDQAYAKLREMGLGLFGGKSGSPIGGQLGETLGNLIQQGLGGNTNTPGAPTPAQNPPSAQNAPAPSPAPPPPSQEDDPNSPMNQVLKNLFSR